MRKNQLFHIYPSMRNAKYWPISAHSTISFIIALKFISHLVCWCSMNCNLNIIPNEKKKNNFRLLKAIQYRTNQMFHIYLSKRNVKHWSMSAHSYISCDIIFDIMNAIRSITFFQNTIRPKGILCAITKNQNELMK